MKQLLDKVANEPALVAGFLLNLYVVLGLDVSDAQVQALAGLIVFVAVAVRQLVTPTRKL